MEIVNERAATEIEEVFPLAAIAGTRPLPMTHMRQGMLDGDALPEFARARGGSLRWRSSARKRSSG